MTDFSKKLFSLSIILCIIIAGLAGCSHESQHAEPTQASTGEPSENREPACTEAVTADDETDSTGPYRLGYYTQSAGLVLEDREYQRLSSAKRALQNPINGSAASAELMGYCVYDSQCNVVTSVSTELSARILAEAREIVDYLRKYNFAWGDTVNNPAVDSSERAVSCDRFVGWALYNAGYTDQPSDYGLQLPGYTEDGYTYHGHSIIDWLESHNFVKINNIAELMPGDIVMFQQHNQNGIPDHMCIYAGDYNGSSYRYDGGWEYRWTSKTATNPYRQDIDPQRFLYAYRAK